MIRIELVVVVATFAVAACKPVDRTVERCTRGVTHVLAFTTGQGGAPSAGEQKLIDSIEKMSIEQCKQEGFTQAQLDCVLTIADLETFEHVAECAAIKAKKPSWLIIP